MTTNVCNSDRRDMRPIDDYFTPIDVDLSPLAEVGREVASSDDGHVVP